MANPTVNIHGKETVSTATQQVTRSLKDVKQSIQEITGPIKAMGDIMKTSFVSTGIRDVYMALANCEAAFVKLHPETQKSAGSMASFNLAVATMQSGVGSVISGALSPLREWFVNFVNPVDLAKQKLGEFMAKYDALVAKYGTASEKATQDRDRLIAEMEAAQAAYNKAFNDQQNLQTLLTRLNAPGARAGGDPYARYPMGKNEIADATAALKTQTLAVDKASGAWRLLVDALGRLNAPAGPGPGGGGGGNTPAEFVSQGWQGYAGGGPEFQDITISRAIIGTAEFTSGLEGVESGGGVGAPMGVVDMAGGQGPTTGGQQYGAIMTDSFSNLLGALKPVVDLFGGLIGPLASVRALLDPLSVIFNSMMAVLGPSINTVLSPLVGILSIVGQTLGQVLAPVLTWLSPIIKSLGDMFVWLYNNIIVPIGNGIFIVFTSIGNSLANFGDLIGNITSNLLDPSKWVGGTRVTDLLQLSGPLTAITTAALATAGAAYMAGQGGSGTNYGSSTTVQQPPDINIHMTFQGPVVGAGGGHQVAEYVIQAIADYLGTGAHVSWLEA